MNVLIIEDDPMVEFIHRSYLEKMALFQIIYSAATVQDATALLSTKVVDLILLDIHLKDGNGLEILTKLRMDKTAHEVILITAANEAQSVKEGLHLGVIDYLIKPFTFERFKQSIELFKAKQQRLESTKINQETIDFLIKKAALSEELEKGLSVDTLDYIIKEIQKIKLPFTIQELADQCGLSHVSVRKYINYLEQTNQLKAETIYTKIGRPYKAFRWL
ncbi:response regulator [Enterococcus dongliensis]|uniref:Transcriptional regulatory protein n=1 Tax=Enterococcus dongliensis TaxID=2559925 RepID=A0AAW8TMI8_9ENTE|nr:response regulator [Enterococcus dongliensis]MDT2604041.1 response regulator [Enterococcus dongliensis]MDT2635608.1 response regulator [Enterococcus dongliensis]MDT2638292.1 response regulator [Enterococcus dongliensis]MDT2638730.1 response regulator [Enterococcus dongliensis]MDT2643416.1 response regulator [Enterococcus dongliensis]